MNVQRENSLSIARLIHANRMDLSSAERVWMSPEKEWERFGYKQGWYIVDGFSFSTEEVTGTTYDMHQGG